MKPGDLVEFEKASRPPYGTRGYDDFPGEYDFHRSTWLMDGLGLVTEVRDNFCRVFVYGRHLWFEVHQLKIAS